MGNGDAQCYPKSMPHHRCVCTPQGAIPSQEGLRLPTYVLHFPLSALSVEKISRKWNYTAALQKILIFHGKNKEITTFSDATRHLDVPSVKTESIHRRRATIWKPSDKKILFQFLQFPRTGKESCVLYHFGVFKPISVMGVNII